MSKAVFPEKPIVRPLAGTDYVLAEDYYFPATVGGWDVVVHVMPGFRTDGASIPRLLWPLFGSPYDPDIIAEAIGHDALYRGRIMPRRDADDAFRDLMKRRGRIRAWKRRRIWLGVRLFGWIAWLRHTPEGVAEARRHISLAFAGGGKNNETGLRPEPQKRKTMKKLMMIALAACAAAMTGCRSIEIENKGEGKGWSVDVFSHWMNSEADSIAASIAPDGTVTFNMNGMKSTPSEEFNKMMGTTMQSFTAMARLAASMYSPGAASIPLTAEAADPEAVAKLVNAQSAAKAAEIAAKSQRETARIKAQAEAAAGKGGANAQGACEDGNCSDCTAR